MTAGPGEVEGAQPPAWLAAFRGIARASLDGVCLLDGEGRILDVSPALAQLLGWTADELRRRTFRDLHAEPSAPSVPDIAELMRQERRRYEALFRTRDAGPLPVEVSASVLESQPTPHLVAIVRDLSALRHSEAALRESGERYRTLFEQSHDSIYITGPDGGFIDVNTATLQLLGYEREELLGMRVADIFSQPSEWRKFSAEPDAEGAAREFEARLRRKTGEEIHCLVSLSPRREPDGRIIGFQGIIHDVTARKLAEERLWHAAIHDGLTGLPNRGVFADRLERSIGRARRRDDYRFAVLFLDLDNFKHVNDAFGHLVGDQLLVAVARRIEATVRPEDTLARIGGDEFAVLLYNVADPAYVQHIAERIQERLREPFLLEEREVHVTASVGIALSTANYERPEDVLRDADIAMYRAKERGREQYAFFEPRMGLEAARRIRLEQDLRHAITREQLLLRYQPVVSIEDGRVSGFEALIRWQHPELGLITPADFIPLAEHLDIIEAIDQWVLQTACSQMREWHQLDGADGLAINVNLSGKIFLRDDLVARVDNALERSGLPPRFLRIEVTESVVLHNVDLVARHFHELRSRGIQLCIDDFGIGYSSLSYLSRFPIDVLKIDRSFVDGIEAASSNREIVRAILTLARNLGLEAIAEGTETLAQLESLRALGSRTAQGFLFSEPMDAEAAGALIRRGFPPPQPPPAD